MKTKVTALLLVFLINLQVNTCRAQGAEGNTNQTQKCEDERTYPLISKADLEKQVNAKSAFIVDVNSVESFSEAHVPTAIHYSDSDTKTDKQYTHVLPKDKSQLIVAYCGGPSCNAWLKAAKKACQLGYTHVVHFKDGISGWKKKS